MNDYNDNRLKEYTIEKMVLFKVKGNFYTQDEAIKKAQTCFEGIADNLTDSIACHSGVTESISTEDWEVKTCRPLISREHFIEDLNYQGWHEFFPNHYITVNRSNTITRYCFVAKECAYSWESGGTDDVIITKFDKV